MRNLEYMARVRAAFFHLYAAIVQLATSVPLNGARTLSYRAYRQHARAATAAMISRWRKSDLLHGQSADACSDEQFTATGGVTWPIAIDGHQVTSDGVPAERPG